MWQFECTIHWVWNVEVPLAFGSLPLQDGRVALALEAESLRPPLCGSQGAGPSTWPVVLMLTFWVLRPEGLLSSLPEQEVPESQSPRLFSTSQCSTMPGGGRRSFLSLWLVLGLSYPCLLSLPSVLQVSALPPHRKRSCC